MKHLLHISFTIETDDDAIMKNAHKVAQIVEASAARHGLVTHGSFYTFVEHDEVESADGTFGEQDPEEGE